MVGFEGADPVEVEVVVAVPSVVIGAASSLITGLGGTAGASTGFGWSLLGSSTVGLEA